MEKGGKIALLLGGFGMLAGVAVYAISKNIQRGKLQFKDGNSGDFVGTSVSKGGKNYQLVEIGSGIRNPKEGETMYALKDCTIEMSNHPDTFPKKWYEEYTRSYKAGDVVGVAYWVSGNKIIIDKDYNQRARRYQHIIKQNSNNAGKLGVFRDEKGNPISTDSHLGFFQNVKDYFKSPEGKAVMADLATSAISKAKTKSNQKKAGKLPDGTQIFVLK